jgi:reactive chlorine resistance protein C
VPRGRPLCSSGYYAYPDIDAAFGLPGGLLSFLTPLVALSFLIATRETWVPALGDAQHGLPFLFKHGRLIIKDAVILAGGF